MNNSNNSNLTKFKIEPNLELVENVGAEVIHLKDLLMRLPIRLVLYQSREKAISRDT